MSKALGRHLRAIVALPLMTTVVIPAVVLRLNGIDSYNLHEAAPATRFILPAVGAALIAAGLALLVSTIRFFATLGQGTLAPWDPTQRLVVAGPYRHVRNPMISGVMSILLGEALAAASLPLAIWFLLFVLANVTFIPWFEEPDLVKRFGEAYDIYRANVPRWVPRLTPWTGNHE